MVVVAATADVAYNALARIRRRRRRYVACVLLAARVDLVRVRRRKSSELGRANEQPALSESSLVLRFVAYEKPTAATAAAATTTTSTTKTTAEVIAAPKQANFYNFIVRRLTKHEKFNQQLAELKEIHYRHYCCNHTSIEPDKSCCCSVNRIPIITTKNNNNKIIIINQNGHGITKKDYQRDTKVDAGPSSWYKRCSR